MAYYLSLKLSEEQLKDILNGGTYTNTKLAGHGKRSVFIDLYIEKDKPKEAP